MTDDLRFGTGLPEASGSPPTSTHGRYLPTCSRRNGPCWQFERVRRRWHVDGVKLAIQKALW